MRRIALAIMAALAPALVVAGATWSTDTTVTRAGVKVVKATSSTGTETAPSSASAGMDLRGVAAIDIYVESISGAMSAGKLVPYVRNPVTGTWAVTFDPTFNLTVSGESAKAFSNIPIRSGLARISFEPSGLGTTATVYIEATGK